jgi:ribosome-binding factor A
MERINQQVKREVGMIIHQELSDPRVQFVTITGADVSKDLRNGKISFSVLGDQNQVHAAQIGLDGAKGMIRKLLGQRMEIRNVPELFFVYDQSIEMSARIEETLKEIHDEHERDNSSS